MLTKYVRFLCVLLLHNILPQYNAPRKLRNWSLLENVNKLCIVMKWLPKSS